MYCEYLKQFIADMKDCCLISPFNKRKAEGKPVEEMTLEDRFSLLRSVDRRSLQALLPYMANGTSEPLHIRAIEAYIITSIETRILRLTLGHLHRHHHLGPILAYTGVFSKHNVTLHQFPTRIKQWTDRTTYNRLRKRLSRLRDLREVLGIYRNVYNSVRQDIQGITARSATSQKKRPNKRMEIEKYINPTIELALTLKKLTSPDRINRDARKKVLERLLHCANTMGFKAALD